MDNNFPFKSMYPANLGDITFFPTPAAAQAVCLRFQAEQDPEDAEDGIHSHGETFTVQTSAFGWVVQYDNGSPWAEEAVVQYYTGK